MNGIPKPEFPRPDRERSHWLNLNGDWEFRLFPQGKESEEESFAAGRHEYDRTIRVPFSWTCPLSGVAEDVAGVGWYGRNVCFEGAERVFLCFGAVDYHADVYINGRHVGAHTGGYTPFEMDVTAFWQAGENRIEVRAEDYRGEYQTSGKQGYGQIQGIWQTIWLEARPQAYIDSFRITTALDGSVEIRAQVCAEDGTPFAAQFDGQRFPGEVRGGEGCVRFQLQNPRWWSPDDPFLYEGSLKLGEDEVSTYFGVREISTVPGNNGAWIALNGKPIYINGTLDQAFNPRGHFTYPSEEDVRMEAWRLKRLGLNMVRIHIKPEEPRKLYWMDRLGILVMEDIPCFWGEPDEQARAAYEREWPEVLRRDINHPSTFAWVMFNETWGLFHKDEAGKKTYRPETQEWVRSVYRRAKEMDPTRLVEDNSPCNYDHVQSDLNTWHFYRNDYQVVRDHVREVVENSYPGSPFNYVETERQTDAPLMNSECGMVWGVDESAGDSDLAWQYHYMLNEFRLHDKLCGFVFTEFHDVVNEFNGYYRIDDSDKDFGYQDFCRGMTLRDLHAADFVATDCPPCRTVESGEYVTVPLVLSSFSDARHGHALSLKWELWYDGMDGRVCVQAGEMPVRVDHYGAHALSPLEVTMPLENAAAVLSLYLQEGTEVISRNFVTFDVRAALPVCIAETPVDAGTAEGFERAWTALGGEKACFGGAGEVHYDLKLPDCAAHGLTIFLEAGAKRVLSKDRGEVGAEQADLGFMRGYLVDRGAFKNSYWMTDEERFPAELSVLIDGEEIARLHLENDWADARGVLSWHAQPNPRRLDEAGSYGELHRIEIPSRMVPRLLEAGRARLTLCANGGGLALYGRNAGRYAVGLSVRAW